MNDASLDFLAELEALITARRVDAPPSSYTAELFAAGTRRMAQKVGEEAVEVALAASAGDATETTTEAADLIYHLLVLLVDQEIPLADVIAELQHRHRA